MLTPLPLIRSFQRDVSPNEFPERSHTRQRDARLCRAALTPVAAAGERRAKRARGQRPASPKGEPVFLFRGNAPI